MMQPKPITMPMLAMVPPKPLVTVLTATPSRLPPSLPVPTSSALPDNTPIRMAEMISEGNACMRVKMIRPIITTTPISIAITGFIRFTPSLCCRVVWRNV